MVDCLIEPLVDQFGRLVKEFEGSPVPYPSRSTVRPRTPSKTPSVANEEVRWLIATFLNQCERAVCRLIGELLDPVAHFPESLTGHNISTVHVRRSSILASADEDEVWVKPVIAGLTIRSKNAS